jgi:biotin synthase
MAGEIQSLEALTCQVLEGRPLSREQAEWMVEEVCDEHLLDLFRGASRIRDHFLGRQVRCCSIAAARVGECDQDCAFCSQSAHYQTHVKGLTVLPADEVRLASREAADAGAQCFGIVTSGLGPTDAEIERWGSTFEKIRVEGRIGLCASMGVLTAAQARRLAELGVRRYNHNLQTSRRHFPTIVSTHNYDDRLATLRNLRAAGIELCCGALFGMGETWADRLDLAFELRAVEPEVVPLNFLIPIAGTPLADLPPLEPNECLKIIAVYRYLLARQEITIAGGRETQLRDVQSWIFAAGATGFLIGNYLTTCGRSAEADRRMVRDLGLEIEPFRQGVKPVADIQAVAEPRTSKPCPCSASE